MAVKITPKRSASAGTVPTTSNLDAGEIAINLADKKLYVRDTSSNILELTTRTISSQDDSSISGLTDGQVLTYSTTSSKWENKTSTHASVDTAIAMAIALG
jgi:hypothetical protein